MYKINNLIEAEDRTRFFCKCSGDSVEMSKFETIWEEGAESKIITRYTCRRCGWVVDNTNIIEVENPGWVVIDPDPNKL